MRSYGATARPRRCRFVTSPGWFVVVNQHFPSAERRGASPERTEEKNARLQAEEGKQSACEQRRAICGSACRPSKAEDGWSQGRRRARRTARATLRPAAGSGAGTPRCAQRPGTHPASQTPQPLHPRPRLEEAPAVTKIREQPQPDGEIFSSQAAPRKV